MLINIHTHRRTAKENQLEIVDGIDSIGIHPWNLNKALDFRKAAPQCLMIGETGLDRSDKFKSTLNQQKESLELHFSAANFFQLPIVLHCVWAHSDLLQILKKINFKGKILLHDFSGNLNQMEAFLFYDCYFSIGRKLDSLKWLPTDRIFLETDDHAHLTIEAIYKQAGIGEIQFEKNLLNFFSDTKEVSSADVINYLSLAMNSY